jgi:hypothetical protein
MLLIVPFLFSVVFTVSLLKGWLGAPWSSFRYCRRLVASLPPGVPDDPVEQRTVALQRFVGHPGAIIQNDYPGIAVLIGSKLSLCATELVKLLGN